MEPNTQAPSKYADLLAQSKEERDATQRDFDVQEAAQDLDGTILATKKRIASAQREVVVAKSQVPFNAQAILDAQLTLEDYQRGLEKLEALKTEMF